MRHRALSDEGRKLYLNAHAPVRSSSWLRRCVCGVFHTQYDDHLIDVVSKCIESTQALAAQFESESLSEKLESAITHTTRLVLTRDNKKVKKRHVIRSFRFFADVMEYAYQYRDYQTVNLMYLALNHPAIQELNLPLRSKDIDLFETARIEFGPPTYSKHIQFWKSVRGEALPSLIAFDRFIARRKFAGNHEQAEEAKQMLNVFQYLKYNVDNILPLYTQKSLNHIQLAKLSKKLNIH